MKGIHISRVALNTLLVVVLYFVVSIWALDVRIPFPRWMIVGFREPYIKIAAYLGVYALSYYNPVISILALVMVVMLHSNDVGLLGTQPLVGMGKEK